MTIVPFLAGRALLWRNFSSVQPETCTGGNEGTNVTCLPLLDDEYGIAPLASRFQPVSLVRGTANRGMVFETCNCFC